MKDSDYMVVANLTRLRECRRAMQSVTPFAPLDSEDTKSIVIALDRAIKKLEEWADKNVRA